MNQEDFTFINYTRYFNYKDSFTIMSDIANRQDCTIQLQEATVVWLVEIWKKNSALDHSVEQHKDFRVT